MLSTLNRKRVAFAACLLLLTGTARWAGAATLDPSKASLLYTGRWEDSAPSEPWAQAKGSSLLANFEGTSFAVTLTTSSSERYRIVVDGDAASSTKTTLASGVSNVLVSGLAPGSHQVELIKETDIGRTTLLAIDLDEGGTILPPPPRAARRIVFYGDSNLAGYSLESERNQGATGLQGSYYTYAGITARSFGAEYHNISKSGATISSLNSRFDRFDWGSPNPDWDFNDFPADVVVVNIGANDLGAPKGTIKNRYHALLDDLRIAHPTSKIVLFNAYGWDANEPANYTHEVVAERSDPDLSSAIFPWVFEQFHGCETDHAGMSVALAAHLTSILGWEAQPPDVVSGYGAGGDVANGSFEERAPFGGWGWRYFDDPGVTRVYDPSGAFQGDHYLRLTDGASSQQTNPSENGAVLDLTVWMRGANDGDEVDITIDFRDQQAGAAISAPIVAHTETRTLTTDWQPYQMSATAPTSPPNPVFASRLEFQARAGDTVDIDLAAFVAPGACADGLDNDGDGLIDHPADPGCRYATSAFEGRQCQDGIDNDNQPGTDFDGGESIHGIGNGDPDGPDPQCTDAWRNREGVPPTSGCGLGPELVLALLPLSLANRARRRNA
jgi:lysophospholipase L1-like esterase